MHQFLFEEGVWLGEGTVQLNLVKESLKFYSRWLIHKIGDQKIKCTQEIEVAGLQDHMHNVFYIDILKGDKLKVELENHSVGRLSAKGIFDQNLIAWEYDKNLDVAFEGYELFEKKENNQYQFKAEFMAEDQLRSKLEGKLWKLKEK
ncbi:MAG: hypothetical protein K940chlam8_00783 [Chlamydiae bacterium]|nr:hypothetical protein [Chlamydiota bacterium]